MTNQTTGMRLHNELLSQGNMQDGGDLLKNFLGRDPGTAAFYRRLGIASASGAGNPEYSFSPTIVTPDFFDDVRDPGMGLYLITP